MTRCQFPDCTEAAELLFTGKALVLPRVPLCGEHAKEIMRACFGMGGVTLDTLPKETEHGNANHSVATRGA